VPYDCGTHPDRIGSRDGPTSVRRQSRLLPVVRHQLERHLHPRQRRSQLVAHVDQQLIAGHDHLAHPRRHAIERVRQRPEFIARRLRYFDRQIPIAEPRHAVVQVAQRPEELF